VNAEALSTKQAGHSITHTDKKAITKNAAIADTIG
jgi:hypothetical protein